MAARLWSPLGLILAAHVALGLSFGLATPIFEAPDEAQHFLFIRYLQLHGALPVQTLDQEGPRAHHPPLYHALAALISAWVPNAGNADHVQPPQSGDFWFRYGDLSNDHKSKYLRSDAERWPFSGQALAVHIIRGLSTAFSAAAVACTCLAARQLLPMRASALAAALLAFNPMVLFMSGVVQNSTAALAAGAGLLYALTRWLPGGLTVRHCLLLGVGLSLAILLQTSGLVLAAPLGAALAYDARRACSVRRFLVHGLAAGLPVLALTGWWFARNQVLYGDWTANAIVGQLWADQPVMPVEQVAHLLLSGMVGRFGYGLIIEYADPVYRTVWAVAALGLAGAMWLAWPALRQRSLPGPARMIWLLHALTVVAVVLALIYYMAFFIRGGHGRYLFTAYPSLALLVAAGVLAWVPARWQRAVVLTLSAATLGLAVYGLFGLLIPTYAFPRSPTAAELRLMTPLDANLGDTARVLGYRLSTDTLRGGEGLAVEVVWQPLSRTDIPYFVFIHLLTPTGSIAQQDTYPGAGRYATTFWDVGRDFVDTYRLTVPADAPAGPARLVLGLYNRETMQRLPVIGADAGSPNEAWVEFGNIRVQP